MSEWTRRQFAASLAGAAAAFAGPRGSVAQGAKIPPSVVGGVTVGVQSYTFRTFSFDRMIAALRSVGLSSVELWGDGKAHPLHPLHQSEADFKKVKAMLDEAGITVSAYCTNFPNDASPDYFDRAFAGGQLLGAKVLTTSCETPVLDKLDHAAEKHKLKVGLHNHWNGDEWFIKAKKDPKANFEGPEDWAQAFKGRSEWLAINLDIGHFSAAGHDPVAFFKENHARIVSIHVKDRGADKKHKDEPFGKGATPITAFCQAAKGVKFPYALNLEYEMDEKDPTEGVRASFAYVKKALS
jgi:sugar phosphate isomerase/epimerase